ncbi:MAG: hypothetical protein NVS4B3_17210 [Gemmatimonadaceae bacterium]
MDVARRAERHSVVTDLGGHSASELQRRMNGNRTRWANSYITNEGAYGHHAQTPERATPAGQHRATQIHGGTARRSRPEDDRQQLCRTEGVGSEIPQSFARPIGAWQLPNT